MDSPLEEDEGAFKWVKQIVSLIFLFGLFYFNFWISLDIPHYNVFLDPSIWLPAFLTLHYTLRSIPVWLRIFFTATFVCLWLIKVLSLYD
jgi:hypothetical protein